MCAEIKIIEFLISPNKCVVEKFLLTGKTAIATHVRKEVVRPKAPQTTWWTGQLSDMKRKLGYISNAIRKEKRGKNKKGRRSRYTYEEYRSFRRKYKDAIRLAQKESFRKFMTEASSSPKEISFISKRIIKKDKMANLGAMEDDNKTVLDPISSMNYTADTHFVDSVPIDPDFDRRRNKNLIVENEEIQQPPLSKGEGTEQTSLLTPVPMWTAQRTRW